MALYDHIDPVDLTAFARAAYDARIESLALSRWFPFLAVDDIDFELRQVGANVTTVAQFRNYDAESTIAQSQPTGTKLSGTIPPLSIKAPLSEYAQLRLRANAGDALLNQAYRDVAAHVNGIVARLNMAMGSVVDTGSIVYTQDEGITADVVTDFGRNANNSDTVATDWATIATADALDDVIEGHSTYRTLTGHPAEAILISETYFGYFLQNHQVLDAVIPSTLTVSRATRRAANDLLADNELPPFLIFDDKYPVAGGTTRVIPEDKMIFMPAPDGGLGPVGRMLAASPVEADDVPFESSDQGRGIVATRWMNEDPPVLWTKAVAAQIPALWAPDEFYDLDLGG